MIETIGEIQRSTYIKEKVFTYFEVLSTKGNLFAITKRHTKHIEEALSILQFKLVRLASYSRSSQMDVQI